MRSLQSRVSEQLKFFVVTGIELPTRRDAYKGGRQVVENVFRISRQRNLPQVPAWTYKVTLNLGDQADTEDFHTLLGTTPGNMITHLLIEQQKVLGHREVKSITFYAANAHARDRGDPEKVSISMVFEIQGGKGEWEPKLVPEGQSPLSIPDNSDESAWASGPGSPHPEASFGEGSSSGTGRQVHAGGGH